MFGLNENLLKVKKGKAKVDISDFNFLSNLVFPAEFIEICQVGIYGSILTANSSGLCY